MTGASKSERDRRTGVKFPDTSTPSRDSAAAQACGDHRERGMRLCASGNLGWLQPQQFMQMHPVLEEGVQTFRAIILEDAAGGAPVRSLCCGICFWRWQTLGWCSHARRRRSAATGLIRGGRRPSRCLCWSSAASSSLSQPLPPLSPPSLHGGSSPEPIIRPPPILLPGWSVNQRTHALHQSPERAGSLIDAYQRSPCCCPLLLLRVVILSGGAVLLAASVSAPSSSPQTLAATQGNCNRSSCFIISTSVM